MHRGDTLKLSDYMQFLYNRSTTYSTIIVGISALAIAIITLMFIIWQFSVSLGDYLITYQEMGASQPTIQMIQERINEMLFIRNILILVFIFFLLVVWYFVLCFLLNSFQITRLLYQGDSLSIDKIKKELGLEKSFPARYIKLKKWFQKK